jgi:hypothetical protein
MGTAALVGLAFLVVAVLVVIANVLGRIIWNVTEPGDEDPGGQVSPARYLPGWNGTPLVEYLRLAKRLRKKQAAAHRRVDH